MGPQFFKFGIIVSKNKNLIFFCAPSSALGQWWPGKSRFFGAPSRSPFKFNLNKFKFEEEEEEEEEEIY